MRVEKNEKMRSLGLYCVSIKLASHAMPVFLLGGMRGSLDLFLVFVLRSLEREEALLSRFFSRILGI